MSDSQITPKSLPVAHLGTQTFEEKRKNPASDYMRIPPAVRKSIIDLGTRGYSPERVQTLARFGTRKTPIRTLYVLVVEHLIRENEQLRDELEGRTPPPCSGLRLVTRRAA